MTPDILSPEHPMIQNKALQIVYDFDALRRPGIHPPEIEVEWPQYDRATPDYVPGELVREEPPEHYMDKIMPTPEKAERVVALFVPVMLSLMQGQPTSPVDRYVEFCQQQIGPFETDALSLSSDGTVKVAEILPPRRVLTAMHHNLIERRLRSSPSLIRYMMYVRGVEY